MGNCYHGDRDDKDILSDVDPLNNIKSQNKPSNINNNIILAKNDIIDNYMNLINDKNNETNIISKTKLKLTVIESNHLREGGEYIINSLGLLNNQQNKKDGLTIFGDVNVIINNKFYNFIYIVKYSSRLYFPSRRE